DPDNAIPELDDTNNMGCAPIEVFAVSMPDVMPVMASPASPIRIGPGTSIGLSASVENLGNATASAFHVAFWNESAPPSLEVPIASLDPGMTAGPFAWTWTAPATPGTYRVYFASDSRAEVAESNESNNQYVWSIDVVPGPVTTLRLGAPNVTSTATFVTSATPLSFSVLDQSGAGIRNTTYRVDAGPWVNYSAAGPFLLAGAGSHDVEWSSTDFTGNVEPT